MTDPFPAPPCPSCGKPLLAVTEELDPTSPDASPVLCYWTCRTTTCVNYAGEVEA